MTPTDPLASPPPGPSDPGPDDLPPPAAADPGEPARFDPNTGAPLNPAAEEAVHAREVADRIAAEAPKFDPETGEPLNVAATRILAARYGIAGPADKTLPLKRWRNPDGSFELTGADTGKDAPSNPEARETALEIPVTIAPFERGDGYNGKYDVPSILAPHMAGLESSNL